MPTCCPWHAGKPDKPYRPSDNCFACGATTREQTATYASSWHQSGLQSCCSGLHPTAATCTRQAPPVWQPTQRHETQVRNHAQHVHETGRVSHVLFVQAFAFPRQHAATWHQRHEPRTLVPLPTTTQSLHVVHVVSHVPHNDTGRVIGLSRLARTTGELLSSFLQHVCHPSSGAHIPRAQGPPQTPVPGPRTG